MRAVPSARTRGAAGKIAAVALLVILVLGLALVGSSETLHQKICPNAGRPGDSCAVATFAGGVPAGSSAPTVLAAAVLLAICAVGCTDILFPSAPLFRLSPCRAPPARWLLPG